MSLTIVHSHQVAHDAVEMPESYTFLSSEEKWYFQLMWKTLHKAVKETHLAIGRMYALTRMCDMLIKRRVERGSDGTKMTSSHIINAPTPVPILLLAFTGDADKPREIERQIELFRSGISVVDDADNSNKKNTNKKVHSTNDEKFEILEKHFTILVRQSDAFVYEHLHQFALQLPAPLHQIICEYINPYWWLFLTELTDC